MQQSSSAYIKRHTVHVRNLRVKCICMYGPVQLVASPSDDQTFQGFQKTFITLNLLKWTIDSYSFNVKSNVYSVIFKCVSTRTASNITAFNIYILHIFIYKTTGNWIQLYKKNALLAFELCFPLRAHAYQQCSTPVDCGSLFQLQR